MITCPVCGQENPDGFRFCGACASPLQGDEPAPREVRKTVTIVFCDMVGSTALGDRHDPERVRTLMAGYHDLARRVLERHGGTIEKFIGDAVMAVFGVPTLHEDDALRAVRAAVELREKLAAAEVPVRIGVNTGEVVAGGGEALVTGDAVNVAARLEQAAGTGEVLIGDTTHRLTRDAVLVEAAGGLRVKGKKEPLQAHRLISVSARAQAIPRRSDLALVGRELELKMLAEAFERAVLERRCHLFTVVGAPGVGKSRLVAELAGGPAAEANVLVGQCLPYGEGITLWPVAEMVRAAAGIGERDDRAAALTAVERLVAEDSDGLLVADRVACAIGLGGSPAAAEEIFWALRRTFELVARRRATVLVFEDIHWAEPTLLDLIEHIADWSRGGPLLVVCTARPDLLEVRPAWGGGKTNATSILLERLPDEDCARLLDELLGGSTLSSERRRRVVGAAEGNPLFVEQMLAMLDEDERKGDVPVTIQALLAARLDHLEGGERQVVESASVEGRVFHRSAVAALGPDSARPALSAHLQRLMRRELIDPDRSLFEGDSAYRFQHVLIRDAAYASLPKRARAELHERFAEWLEERVAHRVDEYREILAHHLEQAYLLLADVAPDDPRLPGLAARAIDSLTAAARHADERGDETAAFAIYRRAAAVPQAVSGAAADLLIEAARAGINMPSRDDVLVLANQARDIAVELGDEVRELHAEIIATDARLMADTGFSTRDARALAERAAALFEAQGERERLFDALVAITGTYHHEGHWGRMDEGLRRAEAIAREMGDERRERDSVTHRLGCAFWGAEPATSGLALCEQTLERWPASPIVRERVLPWQARLLGLLGRFEEADRAVADWLAEAEQLGQRMSMNARAFVTATLAELRGDLELAESETAWSVEQLDEGGQRGLVATLAGFQSIVLGRLGRWDEAAAAAAIAREPSHPDDLDSEAFWRRAEAQVIAHRGDLEEAVAMQQLAIEVIDRSDELMFQANARTELAGLLERSGDLDGARAALGEALTRYRAKEVIPAAAAVERRLAELRPDQAAR
jgi:class 3 adenylate cyclase